MEMTQKITAKQARSISGISPEQQVELVYKKIRTAAEQYNRRVKLTSDFWSREAQYRTSDYLKAVEILKKDGYLVDSFYSKSAFITLVRW